MVMTAPASIDAEWETAIGRAAVYRFCAAALAHPTPTRAARLADLAGGAVVRIRTGRPQLDDALARAAELALWNDGAAVAARQRAWLRVFSAVESQDCPAHEATYETNDVFRQAHLMADVAGFYRAHGVTVGGTERERPDHIAAELEYLGFLAHKQAYAIEHLGGDAQAECVRTQRRFLRDHLGRWAPSFGRRLALVADEPFLRAVGELIAWWVEADLDDLGVAPATVLDEPAPPLPPDDGTCGLPDEPGDQTVTVTVRRGQGARS
jgi:TorA maturation chaperone TorD